MKIKINVEFDLENPFEKKILRNTVKTMFNMWAKKFNLKNLKVEFE